MRRSRFSILLHLMRVVLLLSTEMMSSAAGELKLGFYSESCPLAETTVRNITWSAVAADPRVAPKLLRLHYTDCFVRGCEASILLDATDSNTPEKLTAVNWMLGGDDIIDEIKEKVEAICPGVVSCADVLALAARDAVSFQFQRSMWKVLTGREDGRVSIANEADELMPTWRANFSTLLSRFEAVGLDIVDLVALSGAHTIGVTHCNLVRERLYNFSGTGMTDPDLDPQYAETLKAICPSPVDPMISLEMDPESSLSFDSHYFLALRRNKGIFRSDVALLTDPRSASLVKAFQNRHLFLAQFSRSMEKMGALGVLTNGQGEIRKNCRVIN